MDLDERASGMLLGLAVGDAIGLPREGMHPARAAARFGLEVRHTLGLTSDDTEHAFMTGQALLASGGDAARFARSLAWRLRGWIASLPPGVGWATLRACMRLWIGFSPDRSGVWSAGNGPLMRAPVIGFAIGDDGAREALVAASTRLTHRDPLALEAAQSIAAVCAAATAGTSEPDQLLACACHQLRSAAWSAPVARLERALAVRADPAAWAAAEGLSAGVTGYVLHTVPAVLYAWLRDPTDYTGTIGTALALGGDTDTTAAIAGALCGAAAGEGAIPAPLRSGLRSWPLSDARLASMAGRLSRLRRGEVAGTEPVPWRALQPLRNLAVTAVLLAVLIARRV